MTEEVPFDELCAYTLALRDPAFIHQHVVDAFAAQQADASTKPIKLTFALVGLYLHLERQFTGRQVQLAHMRMGRRRHQWPTFVLPSIRGAMTACDVLDNPARACSIDEWCQSVWNTYVDSHQQVADLLREHEICP